MAVPMEDPRRNTSPVAELRNEREITRAIKYAEGELEAHLQLGTADTEEKALVLQGLTRVVKDIGLGQTNQKISMSIDGLFDILTQVDQATKDLVAGAQAQVIEFEEELATLRSSGANLPEVSFSEIALELKRREKVHQQTAEIQEQFENERDVVVRRLKAVSQVLAVKVSDNECLDKVEKERLESKVASLSNTIAGLIETLAENDREMELLTAYQNAVRLVNQGLPKGLIGK